MELFIQPETYLEKTAGEVELPEDPNMWPQEVLQELFKQVPYISDFQPHVVMDKVDAEQGYGLGHVEIANQSEAQVTAEPEMAEAAGIRTVRIPVVIREGKLTPFDLLINDNGKILPLTESRIRQALFRPQAFDVTSKTPGDQSMIGQLYPPYRQNYGFGRTGTGVVTGTGLGKMGSALDAYLTAELEKTAQRAQVPERPKSDFQFHRLEKKASILESILPTLNRTDFDSFWEKVSSDHSLQAQFRHNADATQGALCLLANHEPITLEKTASALAEVVKPTVAQVTKTVDGYLVKTASHLYWKPQTRLLNRGEVIQEFGEKVALAADESGGVTLAEGADAEDAEGALDQEEPISVSDSGLYKVYDDTGKELVGFVIPNLLDTDGTPLPLSLFTNGSQTAVQDDIQGVPAGDGVNLPTAQPGGRGAFFSVTDEGSVQATVPLVLGGSYATGDGQTVLNGQTFDGRPVEVSVQSNIQTVMGTPEGRMLVPESWQWTPMSDEQVSLYGGDVGEQPDEGDDEQLQQAFGAENEGEAAPQQEEQAEEKQSSAFIWVRSGGPDTFSVSGPALEKLAYSERESLSLDDAMFLLAGLGVSQAYGVKKLAHACSGANPERVRIGRIIKTAAEVDAWSRERAQALHSVVPRLKQDLVKEAALIPNPSAVDTVLSLGFINPENIMTFVGYLPDIDGAQGKLCELLLASRLGMDDIPASALERAVRSVEETIEGLKVLAFQGG